MWIGYWERPNFIAIGMFPRSSESVFLFFFFGFQNAEFEKWKNENAVGAVDLENLSTKITTIQVEKFGKFFKLPADLQLKTACDFLTFKDLVNLGISSKEMHYRLSSIKAFGCVGSRILKQNLEIAITYEGIKKVFRIIKEEPPNEDLTILGFQHYLNTTFKRFFKMHVVDKKLGMELDVAVTWIVGMSCYFGSMFTSTCL